MPTRFAIAAILFTLSFNSCSHEQKWTATDARDTVIIAETDTAQPVQPLLSAANEVNAGTTDRIELVNYAKTLIGVPYKYASTDPNIGFDCSGFITYVFNHFDIAVPRSSVDFTNVGTEVEHTRAIPGDLILFTGTDSTIRVVGHMGIITENNSGELKFIHSTSGKQMGVTITPFENYYKSRFVKVIRVFPER
jgi:murein DD-endopeptidase / murein LD-carboxypeptidase